MFSSKDLKLGMNVLINEKPYKYMGPFVPNAQVAMAFLLFVDDQGAIKVLRKDDKLEEIKPITIVSE